MTTLEKLTLLADAAKYDVACTSSGADRAAVPGAYGNAVAAGICHTFAADGRCVSLLKVLQSNACAYDCAYCGSRRSNDAPRATFAPEELASLTFQFYRRNYIEGLFLSSAVVKSPDHTCELMTRTLSLLRGEYRFNGYIHVKAIPGADPALIEKLGLLADRMSVNIELPSSASLSALAPQKSRDAILAPMTQIRDGITENTRALTVYRHAQKFAPAGQSTQMIIGATPETDRHILTLSESLYQKFRLKRVFFSAYIPLNGAVAIEAPKDRSGWNPTPTTAIESRHPDTAHPPVGNALRGVPPPPAGELAPLTLPTAPPPLLREHRLYQADWLLRFYGFTASEILTDNNPNFDPELDPKCQWALDHIEQFPVEVNRAPQELLLRVPGVGIKSAWRIVQARRTSHLTFDALKKLGVVLKRAQYFLLCQGKAAPGTGYSTAEALRLMLVEKKPMKDQYQQLSLLDLLPTERDHVQVLTGQI